MDWTNDATQAEWICATAGSDTCIIPSSGYAVGDTFYITVACMKQCTYDIKSYYSPEYVLEDSVKTPFRWNGTSTTVLRYDVPRLSQTGGLTNRVRIVISPEAKFEQIRVVFSSDSQLIMREDRASALLLDNSMVVYITDETIRWCTDCSIWLIVNTIGDRRLYVTASAINQNPELLNMVAMQPVVLRNQIDCFSYAVLSSKTDI